MSGTHDHRPVDSLDAKRVLLALWLTGTFMIVEVIGGLISGSLALLADAGHMLTDTMSLGLAWVAFRVSERPADVKRTYGYQRFQILAAFVNGITLLFVVGWILVEAVQRFFEPVNVMGRTMLFVAVIGLVVNLLAFRILRTGNQENLNLRGAALHVVGDLLGSAAAIIAASVILATGWMPIDPLLSMAVAFLILRSAWELVKRSAHVLLEGAPEWLDVAAMEKELTDTVPAVEGIHHVHVWSLTPAQCLLTMHARVNEGGSDVDHTRVLLDLKRVLRERFGIDHATIEIDGEECADGTDNTSTNH